MYSAIALGELVGLGLAEVQQLAQRLLDGGDLVLVLEREDDPPAGLLEFLGVDSFLGPQSRLGQMLIPALELAQVGFVELLALHDGGDFLR